jgi:WD40 repeat protein
MEMRSSPVGTVTYLVESSFILLTLISNNYSILVYDLLADRRTVKIEAHEDDVNSCCWADTASGNVLISASDDTFLKVW